MSKQVLAWLTLFVVMVCWTRPSEAQLAPTGTHYAGRPTDTGFTGPNGRGGYSASVPLDLPPAHGGLPVPIQIVSGSSGYGAAGVGWDIPLSFVYVDDSYVRRRPAPGSGESLRPRERVSVSLLGRSIEMLRTTDGWIGRFAPDVTLKEGDGNTWIVHDGNGWTYTFRQDPKLEGTGGPYAGPAGVWLLDNIRTKTNSIVELGYEITLGALPGGTFNDPTEVVISVDLTRVSYNSDVAGTCYKNDVLLAYDALAVNAAPHALSIMGASVLARFHKLAGVRVMSRASCTSAPEILRRYQFDYAPDTDTQQDRLASVTMFGRQGTPEAVTPVPVARYHYGSASTWTGSAEVMQYAPSATSIVLPAPASDQIARSDGTGTGFSPPVGSKTFGTSQNYVDMTGDGVPDLVYQDQGHLMIAKGTVGASHFGTPASLETDGFTRHSLDLRSSDTDRFHSIHDPIATAGDLQHEYVWTQSLDVNGDGRLDVIDAAEQPDTWVIYLNTPSSGASGIQWVRRTYDVTLLRAEFERRGLTVPADYVPLMHRVTGRDHREVACLSDWGSGYVPIDPYLCWASPPQYPVHAEQTFVEYEVKDLNGDGFADVAFTSSRVDWNKEPDVPSGQRFQRDRAWTLGPVDLVTPKLMGVFNVAGMALPSDASPYPFSIPEVLLDYDDCGVEKWGSAELDGDRWLFTTCSLVDVNGDGLVDFQAGNRVMLGNGYRFTRAFVYAPPGAAFAEQHSDYVDRCVHDTKQFGHADQIVGLRDLTGDGIPDLIRPNDDDGGYRVFPGTGAGFSDVPFTMSESAGLSYSRDNCDQSVSTTVAGIYDVDADGMPDYVETLSGGLRISPLSGGSRPGNPEAGRLTEIDNGYGAKIKISYRSAKEDTTTRHAVPGAEVVVASIETVGTANLGGTLATTNYAYGDIGLVFDSIADGFRADGYLRRVELTTAPGDGHKFSSQTTATITDTYPVAPVTPLTLQFMSEKQRLGRILEAGRISDVTVLATTTPDPWALLTTDVNSDPSRIAGAHYSVDTMDTHYFGDASPPTDDNCVEINFPYDYKESADNNYGFNTCIARGFLVTRGTQSWRGSAAPPAAANVQAGTFVRSVDDFGRVTSILYSNDLSRNDDDYCVDTTYATPTSVEAPILAAVASRKVWDCGKSGTSIVLGEESFEYDKLYGGMVSQGLPTSHTVYRHATDTGAWLGTIRQFDADYDVSGNAVKVTTSREDGAWRTTEVTYDGFGLAPTSTRVSGSAVPTLSSSQALDPVTEQILTRTDENGTLRGAQYDGFGRIVLETATPVGANSGVLAAHSYLGFDGSDPFGRRVSVKEFADPVKEAQIHDEPGRVTTTYLDELGRIRFDEVELGDDYAGDRLIVGARTYDPLGRVAFEADPYSATQDATKAYGTTNYYNKDGSLWVSIRGSGPQLFTTAPNASIELFPAVFTHTFANHVETTVSQDASSLTAVAPQYGVTHESTLTAVGRTLSAQTRQNGSNLEYETFTYDLLGQQASMTRYQNPVGPGSPVTWSWQHDTLGQTLHMTEPASAPQDRVYSNWGELKSTTWSPTAPEPKHSIVSVYDALGRLVSSEEQNGGSTDPATVNKYSYDHAATAPFISPTNVLGRLASASTPTDTVALSYDGFGNVTGRSYTDVSSSAYVEEQGFHADGSQSWVQLRLPDATYVPERMDYAYDTAGRLRWMWFSDGTNTQELFNASGLDAWGRLRTGSFAKTQFTGSFDDVGRRLPKYTKLESASGTRVITFDKFDAVGRELSRTEDIPSFAGSEDSTYDALGRLKNTIRRNGVATIAQWAFTYDPLGNVTKLDDQLGTADASMTYLSTDRDRICAIAYTGAPGPCNVEHDSFGNITHEPTRTAFNKLSYFNGGDVRRISNPTRIADFTYDAFGSLQDLQITEGGTKVRHDHHFGASITQRSQTGTGGTTTYIARQFPAPGMNLSRRGPAGRWIYALGEARGTRFTIDEGGKFVQDINYTPFGNASSTGAAPGAPEFTSEQWNDGDALEGFGLLAVGKRLYDPSIGRFLSRDPIVVARTATSTNPYGFAFNDPLNESDSTGMDPHCEASELCISTSAGGDSGGASGNAGAAVAFGIQAAAFYFATGKEAPMPMATQSQILAYSASFDAHLSQMSVMNQFLGVPEPDGIGTQIVGGLYDAGAETLGGFGHMVRHPIDTVEGMLTAANYMAHHPIKTIEAVADHIEATVDAVYHGDIRLGVKTVGSIALGVLPVGELGTLGEIGEGLNGLRKGVEAGEAGSYGMLKYRSVVGDGLDLHHMPQAAREFTTRTEGGAIALTKEEHMLTRTYGGRGTLTAEKEADLNFRTTLARDIRDVRRIAGGKYDQGLRDLLQYYRQNFPELMRR